ncbi:MAG: thiol reductant ABC exporter subunit CydD [Hamadaea sp.]|uniref:thiol reductant ABC exporter subunit CydD n=1 Tax=Hamadaea sp. TaxID=2024425 RepID=UPI0017D90AC9|nr:thiol reductant ABC exporter subunit CydD [Hamadaea sp.]NUR74283.1 thiol reductant ABC exporter subunit CydD [Hamadaea sp.]NUT23260.1 thiol reductant ABC exporter subunit CydD [Hamadaea sp.]
MRPFDPRLLRAAPAARGDAALLAASGVGVAVAAVGSAYALARTLAAAADGRLDTAALAGFVVALGLRALLAAASGLAAARMSATVKAQLRHDLLQAVGDRGPAWLTGQRAGELATLTGRGLDALDGYFTGYLPQLILGVTVPAAVLITLAFSDLTSAIIVLVTLPLLPIFGILIGWQTQSATEKQWRRLQLLGGHFLDMVAGLPTLRAFGRAQAQVTAVRKMADQHRIATMQTLRIAFLSALVLELVGTISVALVAVPVGLRLLSGGLTLSTALLVLLLTPEAYAPLRAAGSRFHASMEGLTALDQAFTLIGSAQDQHQITDTQASEASDGLRNRDLQEKTVARLDRVTVEYERGPALNDVSLDIRRGDRIALVGPSGGGKTTLVGLLLGFVTPTSGAVLRSAEDLEVWRRKLAWVPQKAHLFAATLAENIALGAPDATQVEIEAAAKAAHLDEVVASLPAGLDTPLGERGHGLSSGERQRLALARAFLRTHSELILLDEPTSRLDAKSEQAVIDATERLVAGRTAVFVAHRPAMLRLATRIIHVEDGRLTERAAVTA